MNIKDAKEQIKNAMTVYFSKDEFGNYIIPIEMQRPVFIMGPPGIGKTAIIEQVAVEMGVGLLSYSMTHHTRQSALGLPFIVHKNFQGMEYDISEYTMSEIIASVYDLMESTGVNEGILFLDEINCVSETLAPIMLQFLQYKIFGRHRIPEGWIIVTAGNPPEFNNSVREFDIVTWDRLKRIDVEPDFETWKKYAYKEQVHPSIITFLEIKKDKFYNIESTVDGKNFVTARGWVDLSQMIILYEKHNIKVDEKLIGQYLQNRKIAKEYANYYDLFNKYRSDYQVENILEGKAPDEIKIRAKNAKFDERLALLGLLLDAVNNDLRNTIETGEVIEELLSIIKKLKKDITSKDRTPKQFMEIIIDEKNKCLQSGIKAGNISHSTRLQQVRLINLLQNQCMLINDDSDSTSALKIVKKECDDLIKKQKSDSEVAGRKLSTLFAFCEEVFPEKQEILILITELTSNYYSAKFINKYGCKEYFVHNKELLFYERQQEIINKLDNLVVDDE